MRILFATIGSLGDLYPCLALALELKSRGHFVAIASTEAYRSRVVELGLGFHPIRPNWNPADPELIRRCEHLKSGPEVLFREVILPHLDATYQDLLVAARHYGFLLAGELVFAAPMVAEKLGLRWGSIILSPCSFLSAYDPSLLVNMPQLIHLRAFGWRLNRALLNLGIVLIRNWWKPVRTLRRKEHLSRTRGPITEDKFSPTLVLALFPPEFAKRQPDWPTHTVQTGFPFYDDRPSCPASPELSRFLSAGEPPLVFTLGSTAVSVPGNFYKASRDAVLRLGKRAVLIGTGRIETDSNQILTMSYVPYSEIFPRASVVVHQGGSGTTGQVMRAGRPQLVVPFGWDQPDNGLRITRLGSGLTIPRAKYSADSAAAALTALLSDAAYAKRAAEVGAIVRTQRGIQDACDAIEASIDEGETCAQQMHFARRFGTHNPS